MKFCATEIKSSSEYSEFCAPGFGSELIRFRARREMIKGSPCLFNRIKYALAPRQNPCARIKRVAAAHSEGDREKREASKSLAHHWE